MTYQYANPEKIGVIRVEGDRIVYIDGGDEYEKAIAAGPLPYSPPPAPDPAETIAAWRNEVIVSQAQIRFALLQMGLLATVQAMADADPYASIAWEYADHIRRNSPFIDGLKGETFTDVQIDDIFRFAMGVQL